MNESYRDCDNSQKALVIDHSQRIVTNHGKGGRTDAHDRKLLYRVISGFCVSREDREYVYLLIYQSVQQGEYASYAEAVRSMIIPVSTTKVSKRREKEFAQGVIRFHAAFREWLQYKREEESKCGEAGITTKQEII